MAVFQLVAISMIVVAEGTQYWTLWNTLPEPVADGCAVYIDQRTILCGGLRGQPPQKSAEIVIVDNNDAEQWVVSDQSLPFPLSGSFCASKAPNVVVTQATCDSLPSGHNLSIEVYSHNFEETAGDWVALGNTGNKLYLRRAGFSASSTANTEFIFGGEDRVEMASHTVFAWNKTMWWGVTEMPVHGCNCVTIQNTPLIVLICRSCEAVAEHYNIMRFDPINMVFLEPVFPLEFENILSLSATAMGQYIIMAVSFTEFSEPKLMYFDLFSNQLHNISTVSISEPRHSGTLFVTILASQISLAYAGGILPDGTLSKNVDIVPATGEISTTISRSSRAFNVGEPIVVHLMACPVGFLVRIARSIACDQPVHGISAFDCTPSNSTSNTTLIPSVPFTQGFICATFGKCTQNVSARVKCPFNSPAGDPHDFESCSFNWCCWDSARNECYAYSETTADGAFFFNTDVQSIQVVGGTTPPTTTPNDHKDTFLARNAFLLFAGGLGVVAFIGLIVWLLRHKPSPQLHSPHSRYEMLKKLGAGGFGTVFLVRRRADKQLFALKYIVCKDKAERDSAMNEYELLRGAQGHPSMINLHDMFMNWSEDVALHLVSNPQHVQEREATESHPLLAFGPRFVSIVMDYCPEGDLADYILKVYATGQVVPESFIIDVFLKQICSLLDYLHTPTPNNPPIVHRDLKPENILLKNNATQIVVTDFGLAQEVDRTYLTTRAGSYYYVAPECWKKHYTTAVDMWGVGCIVYGSCTGRVTEKTIRVMWSDAKEKHFAREINQELAGYSPLLRKITLGLLETKPEQRLTSQQVLEMLARNSASPVTSGDLAQR